MQGRMNYHLAIKIPHRDQLSQHLQDVSWLDEGFYTCMAGNTIGETVSQVNNQPHYHYHYHYHHYQYHHHHNNKNISVSQKKMH